MNFDKDAFDKDIKLNFQPISNEPQLVIIPVSADKGVVAVVKPSGNGQASCIAFAPETNLSAPFVGYRPSFLRKMVTTDFSLRDGSWKSLSLDSSSSNALRSAVTVLMAELEKTGVENVVNIDMERQANTSSAPDAAFPTFRAGENTTFEKALSHLMGVNVNRAESVTPNQNTNTNEDTASA